jgi:exopolysaccharide biosynthesis polyprenyl glycosylphosphotransferase
MTLIAPEPAALEAQALEALVPAFAPARRRPSPLTQLLLADSLALITVFIFTSLLTISVPDADSISYGPPLRVLEGGAFLGINLLALSAYGLYGRRLRRIQRGWFQDLPRTAHAAAAAGVASWLISRNLPPAFGTRHIGILGWGLAALAVLVLLPASRALSGFLSTRVAASTMRVAVVGSGQSAEKVLRRLGHVPGVELVGLVDDGPDNVDADVHRLGGTIDLAWICSQHEIDRLVVCSSSAWVGANEEALRRLPSSVGISVVPEFSQLLSWRSQVEDLKGMALVDVVPSQRGLGFRAAKRAMDVAVSCFALLFLSPVLLTAAVLIKATSRGPVFFRQTRVGKDGRTFQMLKLRSMREGADALKAHLQHANEADGPMFKMREDPRVTSVGRVLRRASLDELPQLFNVLVGQMSLVGPRPLVLEESAKLDGWARRRFDVRPGMTGLWQVSGRSDLPFDELRALDYAYATSWSLQWDVRILMQTPRVVLKGHGAY